MTSAIDQGTNQRKGIALTISVGLHVALLLFFLFWNIITPIPPFPDKGNEGGGSGFELALGFTELGMGDNSQNQTPSTPAAQQEVTPPPASENEVLTSEVDENDVAVKPTEKDKPKPDKPKPEKPKPTKEQQEQKFKDKLNDMWNNPGTGSTGHGASDTPGNAGGADGSPNGNGIGNGTGSYRGDGWSVDLAGRTIKRKPVISDRPSVAGKVAMDIWVDADGKVVRVVQNTSKSTTLDQTLVSIAKRAALESTFYPNPKATGDQKGTMYFTFDLE